MPENDANNRAVAALDAAIAAHEAARDKVDEIIALKDLSGADTSAERARRAALEVTIGNLRDERAEYRAAASVVSAPTPAEIAAVRARIQEIQALAASDAARQEGQNAIQGLLHAALNLKNQNAKA